MATREQLIAALRAADAAGDRPAAEKLAAALQRTSPVPSPSEPLMEGSGGDGTQPGSFKQENGKTYQYVETKGMAGATGDHGWVEVNPEAMRQSEKTSDFPDAPWYEQAGTAADDLLRLGSNGITFGFRDKLAQYVGGADPDTERAKTAGASERAGFPGDLAEAGGMMMLPGLGLEKLASKAIPASTPMIQKLLGYGSAAAGEGAIVGGLDAAGHDQNIIEGAQRGALVGPLARAGIEVAARGASKVAGALNPKPVVPRSANFTDMADADYSGMRREKINVRPHIAQRLATKNMQDMRRFELDDIVHPAATRRTAKLDEKLSRPGGISLNRLDAQRSAINRDLPQETAGPQTASILRGNIDDFIERLDPTMTTGGRDPARAIELLKSGRVNSQKAAQMGDVETAIEQAERKSVRGKTSDVDAAIRSEFEPLVRKSDRGWSPELVDQLKEVTAGGGIRKAMQQLGRLSPTNWSGMGGAGIGGGIGLGYAGGGITGAAMLGAAVPAAGYAGKRVADRLSRQAAEETKMMIAAGGPVKKYTNAVQDAIEETKKRVGRFGSMLAISNSSGRR